MPGGPGGQEVGRVSVRVVPNVEGFRRELKKKLEEETAGLNLEVPVGADFDANGLRAKAKAAAKAAAQDVKFNADSDLEKAVAALGGRRVELDVDFDETRLQQRLAKIKPKVEVEVDVDQRGLGMISRITDKLTGIQGPKFGTGPNPTGWLVGAAAILPMIAPVIGLITTALLALPGAIALVGVPIGALTLGMEGLGKAAARLKGPFDGLKAVMSSAVEGQFAPVFDKLAGIFPTLEASLPKVTQGLADMFDGITNAVTRPENLEKINTIITDIGGALTAAKPGVDAFTSGLLGLVQGFTGNLGGLTDWFNTTGASFESWVKKITNKSWFTGKSPLDEMFGGLGASLKTIGDGLVAISGKSLDFMKDPEKTAQFATAIERVANAMEKIVNFSDKVYDIDEKFKKLTFASPAGEEGGSVGDIFSNSKDDGRLTDFDLGGFWEENKREAGVAIGWIGDRFGELFDPEKRADAAKGMWETLFDFNKIAASPGTAIIDWFKNTVGIGLPQAAAETGTQAGNQIGLKVGEGIAAAGPQIAPQIQTLAPQIEGQIAAATAPLQQIPAQIQQSFAGIGAAVTGSMANVVGAVAGAGGQIVAAFTGSLSQIPGVAAQTFNAVAAAAAAGMANVVSTIAAGAAQAVATVTAMGQQIVAALQSAASGAQAAGAAVGAGMAAGISSSIPAAVGAAQALAAAVTSAAHVELGINSPSKVFDAVGASVVEGLQDGLEGGFPGVIERATALAEKLSEAVNGGLEGVNGSVLNDAIKQQLDELELQRKELKVAKNALPKEDKEGRAAVQNQMDQIGALKDQLSLQKEQLGFGSKYSDSTDSVTEANNIITDQIAGMIDLAKGFFNSVSGQFMSDLGMSGSGALPTVAGMGLDWATGLLADTLSEPFGGGKKGGGKTEIHVNSVDEALAAKQNLTNKEALRYRQR
jgi:hypothetical protein